MNAEQLINPPSLEDRLKNALDENFDLKQKLWRLEGQIERYEEALNNIRDYQFHILCDGAEHEIACCNIAKKALENE